MQCRFAAALLPLLFGNNVRGHTTRAPPVGFELLTKDIQFYAIANLDKISLILVLVRDLHCGADADVT